MTLLSVKNVDVGYYGSGFSIKNINLSLDKGESVIIYSRENFGKTTVLRTLAKLEDYQKGEIYVENKPLREYSQKDLDFGYTFDESVLPQKSSVADVISYPMRLRGLSDGEINAYLSKVETRYGLKCDSKIYQLTDEQKTLLIIARLFSVERRLYLIDDVWKDLEISQKLNIAGIIKENIAGKSAVIATGDKEIFDALGVNAVVVLSDGYATEQTNYQELMQMPPDMESAIFCDYELHVGKLEKKEGNYFALLENNYYEVSRPISDVFADKDVCFAIKRRKDEMENQEFAVEKFFYDLKSERIISASE